MSKTIKEIADELGVSKTAIRNKMTSEFRSKWVQTSTTKGVQTLVITSDGVKALKSMFQDGNKTTNLGANKSETEVISNVFYERQILKQLEQIEILQKLLDQQQQLLLNEQKKSQIFLENKGNKSSLFLEERIRQLSENNQHYLDILKKIKWHRLLLSVLVIFLAIIMIILIFLLLSH